MKIIASIFAVAGAVAVAVLFGPILGAVCGGVTAVVADWWFPVVGEKAMAVTFTHSVWDAGLVLGFFSGFIKATLTTKKD